ncbi:hypothetical protein AB0C28_51180 [Nonomuraea sp. NPDC048892]|uniref:hypothetical protein n=1 Tax=Nonomuraea sp. NPDC048892 TaxID=3154624 RepID=UPI000A5A985A
MLTANAVLAVLITVVCAAPLSSAWAIGLGGHSAIAAAAFGLLRRAGTVVAWIALALAIAVEVGWEIGLVDDTFFLISPFAHVHCSPDFRRSTTTPALTPR